MQASRLFLLFSPLFFGWPGYSQEAAIKDTFQSGKTLWASGGDRDGALAKFEQVIAALEPQSKTLSKDWMAVLCETYNWLAVLDDRTPARKARVSKDLETLLALNPDFDVDKTITNARMQRQFEELRNSKLCKVKFTLEPENGTLLVDNTVRKGGTVRYLTPGSKIITYKKPGYKTIEQKVELALREPKSLEFKLARVSSTVTLNISPSGAEVLLDGKPVGTATGTASPEYKAVADKLGVDVNELSAPFTFHEISPGKHLMEFRATGYQTKQLELGSAFAEPFADHLLEPVKLEASRAWLTVESTATRGELFLSGKTYGPLPVQAIQVPAGSYDLHVKYPLGAFIQKVTLAEGGTLTIKARPMARLVFLGMESGEFAGKDRLLTAFDALGNRLTNTVYLTAQTNEKPHEALQRLKNAREAELFLAARPAPGSLHELEVTLGTFTGEEERTLIKPLERDPLGTLVQRINNTPDLWQNWAGVQAIDLSGEKGPVVIQAEEAVQKAGLRLNQAITHVNGKAVPDTAAFQKALQNAGQSAHISLTQGGSDIKVSLQRKALEIPLNAGQFCYPSLLMDLRLRQANAKYEESGFLRLNQALCLMHFQAFDRALEALRDTKLGNQSGLCQGTADYYSGLCLQRLGNTYVPEAIQAFSQALKYPNATLFGPDGPLLAPLAKQALSDLKP